MAALPACLSPSSNNSAIFLNTKTCNFTSIPPFPSPRIHSPHDYDSNKRIKFTTHSYRITTRGGFNDKEEEDEDEEICSFNEAVSLFNKRDYYKCHDVLEALWIKSQDPTRTLLHGILQCAVGFHHLFNQVC